MPELPEVETVRTSLERLVVKKTIAGVDIHWPRLVEDPETFADRLAGKTIQRILRRGKYLLFDLDEIFLLSHLRMEGKYFLKDAQSARGKHEHVKFTFTDRRALFYHDVRKFGMFALRASAELFTGPPLATLGPEPFDEAFDAAHLEGALKGRRPLKAVLLDQRVVAGIGNIYADEILHCAKLHPETPAGSLSRSALQELAACTRAVLAEAIALGGTNIRTYKDTLGVDGRFQQKLAVHTREGEACPTCGHVIAKKRIGGRGSYFCPVCQKR